MIPPRVCMADHLCLLFPGDLTKTLEKIFAFFIPNPPPPPQFFFSNDKRHDFVVN